MITHIRPEHYGGEPPLARTFLQMARATDFNDVISGLLSTFVKLLKDTWHEESGLRNVCTREHEALLALPPETMAGRFSWSKPELENKSSSVSDPDWIRIQSGPWIRVRIRIRNPDPVPGGQK
jgi:hypothetical protein